MDTLSASSLDFNDAAALAGGENTLDVTADRAGAVRRGLSFVRRNFFWTAVAILIVAAAGALAYLRTWPPMAIVQSGSMVPTIQIGDVEILKHLDGPPRVGDIIVVHVPDSARARYGYPPVITHRAYRISHGEITTKGDALKVVDPFQTPVNTVTEQVVAVIPDAGRVFGFFTSTWGMLWMAIGALLLIGLPLLDRRREQEAHERKTVVTLQEQLETLTSELAGRRDSLPLVADGPAMAPVSASVETELRALVEQATSTQQTLAGATAALQEEQHRLEQQRRTAPVATVPAAAAPDPGVGGASIGRAPAPAGPPASVPPAVVSWSWAFAAAAATVVGCRLRGNRRGGTQSPGWVWPSSRAAPEPAEPLKPLTEVLSNEALARLQARRRRAEPPG